MSQAIFSEITLSDVIEFSTSQAAKNAWLRGGLLDMTATIGGITYRIHFLLSGKDDIEVMQGLISTDRADLTQFTQEDHQHGRTLY